MLESVFSLMVIAGVIAAAGFAFLRPQGIYMGSAMAMGIAVLTALSVWAAASPFISAEAGFGAFVLFCAVVVLGMLAATAASVAATLRHGLDALTSRLR